MSPSHLHPHYIVDESDRRRSVILPLDEFTALLEDLDDLAAVAERRDEPSVSHTDLLDGLKRDGLLCHLFRGLGCAVYRNHPGRTSPIGLSRVEP